MKNQFFSRRKLPSILACLLSVIAHALAAEVKYQVEYDDEQEQPHQRLLILMLDGFRHDYLENPKHDFPGFRKVMGRGARPKYMIPDFPSLSYPNYYSFMTGLHTEEHGMMGNYMYDVERQEAFLIGTNPEQYHAHWWEGGEPLWVTAEKQNRTCHMYYWPGCEVRVHGVKPAHCSPYKSPPTMDDFRDAIVKSLENLQRRKTDVAAIYFELTDSIGHQYGPDSDRLMHTILDLDPIMTYLAESLTTIDLNDVNLVIASDHGMTSVSRSRVIDLSEVLSTADFEIIMIDVAVASIYTPDWKETEVYNKLKDFHPSLKVYRRDEIPDRWHYKRGRYVAPLTAVADMGWFILGPGKTDFPRRPEDDLPMAGWHGYAPDDSKSNDMMSLFIGMGPGFQQNVTSPPINIVDLYQVMCLILDIQPAPNSGSWSRVADIITFDVSTSDSSFVKSSSILMVSVILSLSFWRSSFTTSRDILDERVTC